MVDTILKITNLTHYFGGLRAVGNFDMELAEGEIVGLIGPNGAGKTTVFNLITGVYRPTGGDIQFNGQSLVGKAPFEITSSGISRTFQTIRLYGELPVIDNVNLGRHFHTDYGLVASLFRLPSFYKGEKRFNERAMELLNLFGLGKRALENAKSLPYGEQRRLEICRALASEPKLLLLDEPAAGMNPQEIEELMKLITWVHDHFDLTILLIEHHMKVVMGICPKIVAMDFGEIIARGTPEEIRQNSRVIEAYLGTEEEEAA